MLYSDYQYNDTLGLVHQDALKDSTPFPMPGIDPRLVEVRLLAPVDISRYGETDQGDIHALAETGLITEEELRARAGDALLDYVGHVDTLKKTIDLACDLIRSVQHKPASAE